MYVLNVYVRRVDKKCVNCQINKIGAELQPPGQAQPNGNGTTNGHANVGDPFRTDTASLPEFPIRMTIWWKLEMPGRLLKDQELVLVVVD